MAGQTVNQPPQITGAGPGTAMLGANTKVRGQPGFMGTQQDALTFANGTGFWTAANTKTRTLGVFLVSQSSTGTATLPNGVTVPVIPTTPDPRIRSL
jgi:hypothetical protein